jgi:hypothetical protein
VEACRKGRPYRDTYQALEMVGLEARREFEKEALPCLKGHPTEQLEEQLSRGLEIPMKCLLLLALGRSWQSAEEARRERGRIGDEEYRRLVEAAGSHLEAQGLLIEAARLRHHYGVADWPKEYAEKELSPGDPAKGLRSLFRSWFYQQEVCRHTGR